MTELLKKIWNGWKKIARAIGVFQTRVFLTLFYYTFLLPFGAIARCFKDPLALKNAGRTTTWVTRVTRDKTLDDLRKQS